MSSAAWFPVSKAISNGSIAGRSDQNGRHLVEVGGRNGAARCHQARSQKRPFAWVASKTPTRKKRTEAAAASSSATRMRVYFRSTTLDTRQSWSRTR